MSNPVKEQLIDPLTKFAKDSVMLIRACTKPDMKEFKKIAFATGIGYVPPFVCGHRLRTIYLRRKRVAPATCACCPTRRVIRRARCPNTTGTYPPCHGTTAAAPFCRRPGGSRRICPLVLAESIMAVAQNPSTGA